jgi:hypothetical protein
MTAAAMKPPRQIHLNGDRCCLGRGRELAVVAADPRLIPGRVLGLWDAGIDAALILSSPIAALDLPPARVAREAVLWFDDEFRRLRAGSRRRLTAAPRFGAAVSRGRYGDPPKTEAVR